MKYAGQGEKRLYRYLKEARTREGVTQKELARRLLASQQEISRIESGKYRISENAIVGYADALGITVGKLFSDNAPSVGSAFVCPYYRGNSGQ